MNKIEFLRHRFIEQYNAREFESAIKTGEVLVREHWHNYNLWTLGYANDLYNLGCIYDEVGKYDRAAELYSDSARQISSIEGESRGLAKRLTRLAIVLGRLGVTEPAFFMHSQVLSIYKKRVIRYSAIYANSLYNLANAAYESSRRREALRYHLDALKIREKLAERTGDVSDVVDSYHSIAFMYESDDNCKKAAAYAEAAMIVAEGEDDLYTSACYYLADLYERTEKHSDALEIYDKLQDAIARQASREHSVYLNIANRRANLFAQMNRPKDALLCYQEICEIFQSTMGTHHIFYANCLRNRGIIHIVLDEDIKAEPLMLESMKIRRDMDEITTEIFFLLNMYMRNKDHEKALELLVYALMRSDENSLDFSKLIDNLTQAFSSTITNTSAEEMIPLIKALNNKEKLIPIISKWNVWEIS